MEIPCKLTFNTVSETECNKTRKLVNDALSVELSSDNKASTTPSQSATESIVVKVSGDSKDCSVKHEMVEDRVTKVKLETWKDDADLRILDDTLIKIENVDDMQAHQPPPSKRCKINFEEVIMGEMLTDVHINLAQSLLKKQFDRLNGLNNTLYQTQKVTWTEAAVAINYKLSIVKDEIIGL